MKCRMCDADYFIRVKDITKTLLVPLSKDLAILDTAADKYGIKIRPRFCPFCGRNLGDEEESNVGEDTENR